MTRSCGWSDACLGDTESRGKNYLLSGGTGE